VTNMSYMFYNCRSFNQPLDNWNIGNVTDMSHMFDCFPGPIPKWYTLPSDCNI
jgi:surface protein